jgi:hypothetical protein
MAGGGTHRHRLAAGQLFLEIDAALGGRVTAFGLGHENVLSGPEADASSWGSTFWTSPQGQWGWPPQLEIDSAPYVAEIEEGALVLTGPVSPALGVGIRKEFAIDEARGVVVATYQICNVRATPVVMAPWEITRVRPHGLTFFPVGAGIYPPSNLAVVELAGVIWFAYDQARISGHPKLFADAGAGWLAHVEGRLLFLKTFPVVPRARQAPDEALIELYAHPAFNYVELEQQGAYEEIAPGSASRWTVRWYLRRLADDVVVAPGSATLLAAVGALLAEEGET